MGYGVGSLNMLGDLVRALPSDGSILEFGQQNIEPGIPHDVVLNCALAIQRDGSAARRAADHYDGVNRCPISELFRGSSYRYRCLDLYPGEFSIVADLNTYSVPNEDRGTFDLLTNIGTTEHVTDQVNAFRIFHDYARINARMVHEVPFTGYLNHGLYNYHPVFFVFLASANEYEILHLDMSGPWLPYTIPDLSGIPGYESWDGRIFDCGELRCHMRKVNDQPFALFTDFDQTVMGRLPLSSPWDELVRTRHDLRVRPSINPGPRPPQDDGLRNRLIAGLEKLVADLKT